MKRCRQHDGHAHRFIVTPAIIAGAVQAMNSVSSRAWPRGRHDISSDDWCHKFGGAEDAADADDPNPAVSDP